MSFTPLTLGTGLASYNYLSRTREAQQAIFDRTPVIEREVSAVTNKLDTIQTADELLEDRTLLKVALGAFGLDDDIDNKAFVKRILESEVNDRQSLVNKLTDKRYLAFAQAFNFAGDTGPNLPNQQGRDDFVRQLEAIETPQDLLSDRRLLRASLDRFGLQDNLQNTYFLERVLTSDLSDPTSLANSVGDPRLVEFAQTFDFFAKSMERDLSRTRLDDIRAAFTGQLGGLTSGENLLAQPELYAQALSIVGLEDVYEAPFMTDVLNSDLNDPASIANTQSDGRFATLAAAFNFNTAQLDDTGAPILDSGGDPVMKEGNLALFLEEAEGLRLPLANPDALLLNRPLKEAAFDLVGLPQTLSARSLADRVLSSDRDDPASFANRLQDARYDALAELFTFEPTETKRTYPDGFVDQVVRNYLDRQFEVAVGSVDPDMRVALSLERELTQTVRTSGSNDARWFSIMSSPPLRQAFEGAFRLPSSFGSIDIDQQLLVLKDKATSFFGTDEVQDFLEPERLDELRQSYLLTRGTTSLGVTSSANAASIILSSF